MRVMVAHAHYQVFGGEDRVAEAEAGLLESTGCEVAFFVRRNETKIASAFSAYWNHSVYEEAKKILLCRNIEILHVHNTHFALSPAIFKAARDVGVPTVKTVHNYRFQCLNGLHLRGGSHCEECVTAKNPIPGIKYGCYRNSRPVSTWMAGAQMTHSALGVPDRWIDTYIAPSKFVAARLSGSGVDKARIVVKPHFVSDPPTTGIVRKTVSPVVTFIYVGRLSEEKGILLLLEAFQRLAGPAILHIAGAGPLEADVQRAAQNDRRIKFLGFLSREKLAKEYDSVDVLVLPSLCWETFGISVVEGMSAGLPAIVPRQGALNELVDDEVTGVKFASGDSDSLLNAMRYFVENDTLARSIGANARNYALKNFSGAKKNVDRLIQVYRDTVERYRARSTT